MRQRLDVDRAVIGRQVVAPATVVFEGGLIVAAGPPTSIGEVDGDVTALSGTLVPGFVDLQVNGFAGRQYGDEAGAIAATSAALLATGVTALCPTITSRAWSRYETDLAQVGPVPDQPGMPRHLGLHLEGPFLSPARAGAHDSAVLVDPTGERVEQLLRWAGGGVAIVTLAPELPGALAAIQQLRDQGVVVSAGHTDATFDELRASMDAGVSMVTHLFNAQRPLGHREPGTAGGALLLEELQVGIILDGHHVHPELAAMVLREHGDRVFAVTDAVATAGLPLGVHDIGGFVVDTSDGAPRLADGTLAGSNLTMDEAFRFVAERLGVVAAVNATAERPAAAVNRPDLGVLRPGACADMVLLDPDLRVERVLVGGRPTVVHP